MNLLIVPKVNNKDFRTILMCCFVAFTIGFEHIQHINTF